MANMMQFELVSPERSLASVQASEVHIPGAEGDLTAMSDHAPLITTLRPGVLSVVTATGTEDYFVTGGFAEISADGTSVLAERAFGKSDLTQDALDSLVEAAKAACEAANADTVDAADKFMADLVQAGSQAGLSAQS